MAELLGNNFTIIVFLHVISAVIWVGGMIAMRYAAHQSLQQLDGEVKLRRVSHALKRLFNFAWPAATVIIITAVIMAVGLGFRANAVGDDGAILDEFQYFVYNIVHVKEAVWMIMVSNLGLMMYLRKKVDKAVDAQDFEYAKSKLGLMGKVLVPVNIVLGISAIFMGVYLRNPY